MLETIIVVLVILWLLGFSLPVADGLTPSSDRCGGHRPRRQPYSEDAGAVQRWLSSLSRIGIK